MEGDDDVRVPSAPPVEPAGDDLRSDLQGPSEGSPDLRGPHGWTLAGDPRGEGREPFFLQSWKAQKLRVADITTR